MTDLQRQLEYANDQHDLTCIILEITTRHDDCGNTLFETVSALIKDRDEWKKEAELRLKDLEYFKQNVRDLTKKLNQITN